MDEPVTPAGRLFLHPQLNQIINCALAFKNSVNIEAIKSELSNSLLVRHPSFSSILVHDKKGREYWRKTEINLEDHIIVRKSNDENTNLSDEEKINNILADFAVSCPLSYDKPLWEVHIISDTNSLILRIHHALGDGISLMTLFLSSCKSLHGDKNNFGRENSNVERKKDSAKGLQAFCVVFKTVWYTVLFVLGFIGRVLWGRDRKTVVSGGDGVEVWPRLVATAKFSIDDMKCVKMAVGKSTINDVLFGVISSGFSRYLGVRSPHVLQDELQITGLAMVNLRKQPGLQEMEKLMDESTPGTRWGNQFGMMLLPIFCNTKNADPLSYVKRSKTMIDQKKQSLEAYFSYAIGNLILSLFGPKMAHLLNYRIVCNTTFTISNLVGPSEELTYAGNPVTSFKATSTSLAHAITMHMVSYAGQANMQILVAKDIIPDPQFLAKCFEDALFEMKNAANVVTG